MFWIIILLIIFMIGFPKQMISIIAFLSCFMFIFWICESLSSDPASLLVQLIVGFWIFVILIIIGGSLVDLSIEKKNKEKNDEDI